MPHTSISQQRQLPDLVLLLFAVGGMVVTLAFGWFIAYQLSVSKSQWQAYNHRVHAISEGFASLQRHAGYGGFIHHYQSMLLERNPAKYHPLITQDLAFLQQDFDQLQTALILPENQQRLHLLRTTFGLYEQHDQLALDMLAQGRSTQDIVRATNLALNDSGSGTLQQMLERANALTLETEQRVQRSLDEALDFLIWALAITLLFLLISTAMQLRRLHQLRHANQAIQEQAMALLAAKEQAEAGERAKSAVLASVTHQFRTPMNSIIGFGQLLESDSTLNADQRDNVQEILTASEQMMGLVQQLLTAAETGETMPELGTTRATVPALASLSS